MDGRHDYTGHDHPRHNLQVQPSPTVPDDMKSSNPVSTQLSVMTRISLAGAVPTASGFELTLGTGRAGKNRVILGWWPADPVSTGNPGLSVQIRVSRIRLILSVQEVI